MTATGHDGGRLALAGAAGTLAAVSSIGLMATSAWLISRSAQHPPVLYLMVPVAAVQAFGIGRGVFRYAERLAGHDAALRILARLRMSAYDKLERLAPAGVSAFRSGDLISRLVTDVDSLTDRWLRVRLPYAVAALAGAAAVAVAAALLPAAGLVLALSLVAAALGAPLLAGGIARRAERQLAPRRGEFAAATVDLLRGAGELAVLGTSQQALRAVAEKSQQVARVQARSAYARASGAAVSALAAGAALWGCLVLGVAGVRAGTMAGVTLAVLALMPLAVHEVFSGLAPAAQEIPRLRSASARVADVLQTARSGHRARPPGAAARAALRHHGAGPDRPLGGGRARRAARRRPRPARRVPGRRDRAERIWQDHAGHGAAAVPGPGRRHGDAGRRRHHHAGCGPGALGDRPVRPGRAHLRLHAAGEPAAGAPRRRRRRAGRRAAPGPAGRLGRQPARRARHRGRRARRPAVRRSAPAARAGPGAAGRLPGGDPRRARRAPRRADRGGAHRGPAGRHGRAHRAADHPPARGPHATWTRCCGSRTGASSRWRAPARGLVPRTVRPD